MVLTTSSNTRVLQLAAIDEQVGLCEKELAGLNAILLGADSMGYQSNPSMSDMIPSIHESGRNLTKQDGIDAFNNIIHYVQNNSTIEPIEFEQTSTFLQIFIGYDISLQAELETVDGCIFVVSVMLLMPLDVGQEYINGGGEMRIDHFEEGSSSCECTMLANTIGEVAWIENEIERIIRNHI
jgi:hypothetical protein